MQASNPQLTPFAPKQARTREVLVRILDATRRLLEDRRFEDAGVSDIALLAGTSVGGFYRRFKDKASLLQHFHQDFFARGRDSLEELLSAERWEGRALSEVIDALAQTLVATYRAQRGLLRALLLYARNHPDSGFHARQEEFDELVFTRLQALALRRPSDINHPQPEVALRFALVWLGGATEQLILFAPESSFAWSLSTEALARELSLGAKAYLEAPRR